MQRHSKPAGELLSLIVFASKLVVAYVHVMRALLLLALLATAAAAAA
jgi:hypothetical protein